jgi:hypothetical protein
MAPPLSVFFDRNMLPAAYERLRVFYWQVRREGVVIRLWRLPDAPISDGFVHRTFANEMRNPKIWLRPFCVEYSARRRRIASETLLTLFAAFASSPVAGAL